MGPLTNRVLGCSVRGPAHARQRLPCQDAWLARIATHSCLAVVSDGMGSRPHAREGALAATGAACDAWKIWRHSPTGSTEDLLRILEAAWRVRLQRLAPETAAATGLLYAEDCYGRAVLAQLGDGVIVRRAPDGRVKTLTRIPTEFGLTMALGVPHQLKDWAVEVGPALTPGEAVLLATDGVAEDIEPDCLGDLITWAVAEIAPLPRAAARLATELRHWPVPQHQDDKTMVVVWKP